MMTHFHSIKLLAGDVFKKYSKKNLGFAVLVEYYTYIRSLARSLAMKINSVLAGNADREVGCRAVE